MILEATRPNARCTAMYPHVDSLAAANEIMRRLNIKRIYEGKLTDGITEYRWAKNKWELMK